MKHETTQFAGMGIGKCHRLSERRMTLGIFGDQSKASLKPLGAILSWCTVGLMGAFVRTPWCQEGPIFWVKCVVKNPDGPRSDEHPHLSCLCDFFFISWHFFFSTPSSTSSSAVPESHSYTHHYYQVFKRKMEGKGSLDLDILQEERWETWTGEFNNV